MDAPRLYSPPENIPVDLLIDLVRSGLALARNERLDDEDGAVEVTRVWITEAGELVLATQTSNVGERPKSAAVGWLAGRVDPLLVLSPASPRGIFVGLFTGPPSQQHPRSPCDNLTGAPRESVEVDRGWRRTPVK